MAQGRREALEDEASRRLKIARAEEQELKTAKLGGGLVPKGDADTRVAELNHFWHGVLQQVPAEVCQRLANCSAVAVRKELEEYIDAMCAEVPEQEDEVKT